MNDFPDAIKDHCNISQFADDTSLYTAAYTYGYATQKLQKGLDVLEGWCRRWRVKLNASKSKFVFFSRLPNDTDENYRIALFDDVIKPTDHARFLGVEFDNRLSFNMHIKDISTRVLKRISVLKAVARAGVSPMVTVRLYKTYVLPLIEYGSSSFIAAPITTLVNLQRVQNEALRSCLSLPRYIRSDLLHEYAGIDFTSDRLKTLNRRLLESMTRSNPDIKLLIENRLLYQDVPPKSPLDVLFS